MEGYLQSHRTGLNVLQFAGNKMYQFIKPAIAVIEVSPSYAKTKRRVAKSLKTYVASQGCGQVFCKGENVFVSDGLTYHPDICFVANDEEYKVTPNGIYGAPDVIIDLLFNDDEWDYLYREKDAFEKAGVKEYWLINPSSKKAQGYLLKDDKFETMGIFNEYIDIQLLNVRIAF